MKGPDSCVRVRAYDFGRGGGIRTHHLFVPNVGLGSANLRKTPFSQATTVGTPVGRRRSARIAMPFGARGVEVEPLVIRKVGVVRRAARAS